VIPKGVSHNGVLERGITRCLPKGAPAWGIPQGVSLKDVREKARQQRRSRKSDPAMEFRKRVPARGFPEEGSLKAFPQGGSRKGVPAGWSRENGPHRVVPTGWSS
jgi:hypothetical protein